MNIFEMSAMSESQLLAAMREEEPNFEWHIAAACELEGATAPALAFLFLEPNESHGGVFIIDPRFSECGRFEVDPHEYYGLTTEGAMRMLAINSILNERSIDDRPH